RNTTDGIVYLWDGSSWEIMVRDGAPGTGTGLELRYSGPLAGENISTTFNPSLHVWAQFRRADQSWPADWARIVGEDGDPGADGVYFDYRFRVAATQPATPTGANPASWSDSPPAHDPDAGDILWMTRALKNAADGSLLGAWSTPVQMTGPQGPTGPPGTDEPTNAVTGITTTWIPQPAGGAVLMLRADTGSDTGSVRIQYQYSSTPGGALDTDANYYEVVTPGAGLSVLVEGTSTGGPSTGSERVFSPLDPSRPITLTPYTGNDGTGTAGDVRTVTPETLAETGSVGVRVQRSSTTYQSDRLLLAETDFAVTTVGGRPRVALAGGVGLPTGPAGSILIRGSAWEASLPPESTLLVGTLAGAAWLPSIPIGMVTNLQSALDGKAASGDYAFAATSGHQRQYMVRSLDATNLEYGRTVDRPTSDYSKAFGLEFKDRATIGAPGAGVYVGVLTMAAYSDASGGATHGQIAFNHTDISFRAGVFGGAWSGWEQFAFRSWVTAGFAPLNHSFDSHTGTLAEVNINPAATNGQYLRTLSGSVQWSTLDTSGMVPTSRAINTASGLTGGGNLTADRTLSINRTTVDLWYAPYLHDHAGVYEPAFSKNTAFNRNFAGSGAAVTVARSDHTHTAADVGAMAKNVNETTTGTITAATFYKS
ncbi:hypothetical protein, partial [Mycolicibacterium sp.]|uniref:hypothetical protein n=1 Tax=Mycolicibacterium sp. TaxID=2320850 RepID=UPI00355F6D57